MTVEELAGEMRPDAELRAKALELARTTARLAVENEALKKERDKLQAFKDWVHDYLDAHGVPHHPPGPHGAEGCRIGDRMDWLMALLNPTEKPT